MCDVPDDSALRDVLSKSTNLMKSLKNSTSESEPLFEIARTIEETTNDYISKRKDHDTLNQHIKNIKSRIDVNKELLRTAISNVSIIKSELGEKSSITNRSLDIETLKDVNKTNIDEKLNDVNKKIQLVIKDIRSKSKGSTRVEKMLEEYMRGMEETTDLLKSAPSLLKKGGEAVKTKKLRISSGAEDRRAEELLRSMSTLRLGVEASDKTGDPQTQLPVDWMDYEGFDTKEELDRFKTLYKKITGEDADKDEKSETKSKVVTRSQKSNHTTEEEDKEFLETMFKELIEDQNNMKIVPK